MFNGSIQVRGLPPFIICIKQAMKLRNKNCWQDNFICGSHKYHKTQTYSSSIYRQSLLQDSLRFLAWLCAWPVQARRLLRRLWGWQQHLGGARGRGEHDPGLQSLPQARQNGKTVVGGVPGETLCCNLKTFYSQSISYGQ